MKNEVNARQLFPSLNTDVGYQPILDAFGNIVIQVDDENYSGDSRVLYNENGKLGVLIFGWGSCSGCDALLACETHDDIQDVIDSLQGQIIWFDDAASALQYFRNHDCRGDYSWHAEETKEFIKQCIDYLSKRAPDVVEVVRCEKCKYGKSYDDGVSFVCNKSALAFVKHKDHFCSYGKRKDGAGE